MKHKLLLNFIENVAKVGFSREAHKMLMGVAIPCLTHILKSVPKDESSIERMTSVDDAHLSTWLRCVGAGTLDNALPEPDKDYLSASLDPPPVRRRWCTITNLGFRRGTPRLLGFNHL